MNNTTRTLILAGLVVLTANPLFAQPERPLTDAELEQVIFGFEALNAGFALHSGHHHEFQETLDILFGRPEGLESMQPFQEPANVSTHPLIAVLDKMLEGQIQTVQEHILLLSRFERYASEGARNLQECVEPPGPQVRVLEKNRAVWESGNACPECVPFNR